MAYQSLTRAELRQRVRDRLPVSAFYLDDELNRLIMEALRVFNSLTGYWKGRHSLATVANAHWYEIGGTITSAMRVAWNGKPLSPCALADLDSGRRYWESESTTSGGEVPRAPKLWGIGGLNCIAIWPADGAGIPATGFGGGGFGIVPFGGGDADTGGANSLTIDGVATTPLLPSDASVLDIGQEELSHLLAYIEHVALFKEGGREFADSLPLFQTFLRGAAGRSAMLLASAPFRAAMGLDADERAKRPERSGSGEGGGRQ